MRILSEDALYMAFYFNKYQIVEFLLNANNDWTLKYLPKYLDKKMISLINRYRLNKIKWLKTAVENTEKVDCSICLRISEIGRKTPCGHYYCSDCIMKWFLLNRSCPYCRSFFDI